MNKLLFRHMFLILQVPILLVSACLIAYIIVYKYPLPPSRIKIVTGIPHGAYYGIGLEYQKVFKENGIDLEIETSEGGRFNIQSLTRSAAGRGNAGADLALIQGGFDERDIVQPESGIGKIQTLANIIYDGLFIFTRNEPVRSIVELRGKTVAVGLRGTAPEKIMGDMIKVHHLDPSDFKYSTLSGESAFEALKNEQVDAAIFLMAPQATLIQEMLGAANIYPAQLRRTSAIIEQIPYMEANLVAKGMLNSSNTQPSRDMTVLSVTASLIARQDLDPGIKRLATAVAMRVNSGPGILHRQGDFPSLIEVSFPAATEARWTLAHGLGWLERKIGFYRAQVVERIALIVLPLLTVGGLLAGLAPKVLGMLLEAKIHQWYGEIKFIEHDVDKDYLSGLDVTKYHKTLQVIEREVYKIEAPSFLMEKIYILDRHIEFVQQKVYNLRGR